jgi:hypothetical protein
MKVSEMVESVKPIKVLSPTPPESSRIQMKKGYRNNIELVMPRKGFSFSAVPGLLFSFIWLGFVAVWTLLASAGGVGFALFSIPFWIIGLLILGATVGSAFSTQTLVIDNNQLTFSRTQLFGKKTRQFSIRDIDSIEISPVTNRLLKSLNRPGTSAGVRVRKGDHMHNTRPLLTPAIHSQGTVTHFFEHVNEEGQEWTVTFLGQFVQKIKEKEISF